MSQRPPSGSQAPTKSEAELLVEILERLVRIETVVTKMAYHLGINPRKRNITAHKEHAQD